jgi:hypothetical protein
MTPGPELRDIHLPPHPPLWPPAPGWWLLAFLLLLALCWGTWRLYRAWQRRRRRRRLIEEVEKALAEAAAADPVRRLVLQSELLRRWARRFRPQAVGLTGQAWLDALDEGLPDRPFDSDAGRLLLQGPFQSASPTAALAELDALVRRRLLAEIEHA